MAKRKLSPQQRETIRKEIRQYLAQKKRPSEILSAVAKKYGITTVTARWYLKSVRGPQSSPAAGARGAKAAKSPKKRITSRKSRKASAPSNGHPKAGGAVQRLVANVQAIAEETFSRAREAKKLIPQWRTYVSRELSLKKLEGKLRRELRLVSSKAQALHRKIRALTSR